MTVSITINRLKSLTFAIVLLFSSESFGQTLLLTNEKTILSFNTTTGKEVLLAKDSSNSYLIYRFGKNGKTEFEFPQRNKSSWQNFTYSYYLRGGGVNNEGMDLNNIYFTNKGFQYVIYHTYYAGDKSEVGVKVINLKTNKKINIGGILKSRVGSLIDFRFNELLHITEYTFDE